MLQGLEKKIFLSKSDGGSCRAYQLLIISFLLQKEDTRDEKRARCRTCNRYTINPPPLKKKQRKKQTNKEGFKVLQYVAILYRGVDQGRVFMVCQVKG